MVKQLSTRQRLLLGATFAGIGAFASPNAALADCLPDASGTTVTCSTADPDGYNGSAVNGLTVSIIPNTIVGGTLSAGTGSAINNEGTITVAGVAVSTGGGSTITNATTATGIITGDIVFGPATDTQVNTLNNYNATPGGITGNITSGGALNVTNTGSIVGNLSSTGNTTITNSGDFTGDIVLGAGNDVVTNTGTLTGNVDLGGGATNVFNADGSAQFPTGTLTADAGSLNTLNLGAAGGTLGAVTNFSVLNVNAAVGNTWLVNAPIVFANGINLNSGFFQTTDASNLGTNTIVNNAGPVGDGGLYFDNTTTGTYAGNMSGTGVTYVGFGGAGTTTFSGVNTTTGGTYIDGGTLIVTGGSALSDTGEVQLSNGGTLDVATTETIGALNDGVFYGGKGNVTLSGGNLVINSGAFGGVISGANGIEKIGTDILTLSGANTFTGSATVTDGTLVLAGGAAIDDTAAVIVNATDTTAGTLQVDDAETIGSLSGNGGTVVLNAGLTTGDATDTAYAGVISGVGGLTKAGTGIFTLTGANSYSGGTTVDAGTLEGNTTSIQGDVLVNAAGTLLFTQPVDGTYAGMLTGTGAVTKADVGILTLTGTNTGFTGTTNLNGGAVAIASEANIGTGPIAFDGGTLQTTGATTLANAVTLNAGGGTFQTDADTTASGIITGAGALTKTGASMLTLTGLNDYTGGTTVSAGILKGDAGVGLQGDIVNNAEVDFTGAFATYAGNMSGTGGVKVVDNAVVGFSGANTYAGPTTIDVGSSLFSFSDTALSGASAFTVDGVLNIQTATNTIGSLSGTGEVSGNTGSVLNIGADNTSTTFAGDFDPIDVNKIGTGTLTLTSTSGLSTVGALGVNGGMLELDGILAATTGTSVASGATLSVGTAGSLTSDVVGASGSITQVNGTITGNIANAGTLSGTGTVVGTLTNSGTVAPGNGAAGILNINGAFAQTAAGTLAISLSPTATSGTGYSQILVTGGPGTATLDGILSVNRSGGLYVAGSTYDIINASGGITGGFASVTGNVVSPFITLTPVGIVTLAGTDQVYRLQVSRTNYAVGIGASATPNQIAVANGFQGLVAGATGGAATAVIAVDNMTGSQAQSFFDQVSPEPYGAYATALLNQSELFTRQVALQMHATPNTGDGASVWGRGYGQWGKGRDRNFEYGTDQDTYGGALGIDYRTGPAVFGVAGGWSHDKLDYALGNSRGKANSWQAGAYLDYAMGSIDFDLQGMYSHGKFNASKSINVATIASDTDARFNGHLWKVMGTVGYNADMGSITLRPFVGFDFSRGRVNSFTETGAGALNLTVASINARRSDAMAGVDLGSKTSLGFSPYARLAYRYDVKNHYRNVSAYFNGDPTTEFTVAGVRPGRSEGDVDAGVSYGISPGSSVFVGYEGTFRKDTRSSGVSAGFRLALGGHAAAAAPMAAPPPPPAPVAPAPLPPCPPAAVTPGPFLVFFDWDKSVITPEAAAVLDRAAEQYTATGQTTVQLAGHADKSGSPDYNVGLSQRRADAVKTYMATKGVPDGSMTTEAFGESRPLVDTADGVREPQNRRVQITFGGASAPANSPCTPQ
ncbi:autotransporter domain-containing protein [Sphingosinicellaceae bacterium]|nr:autotransporter domain-containing protein [Sphingosinicellaceae bacterium]